jgi:hypothetical protein
MTTCIPVALGVPALPGPPNWFDDTLPAPQHWSAFDDQGDPRWQGAIRKSYGLGSVEHVAFRALHAPVAAPAPGGPSAHLYLAWDVSVDPSVDPDADGVYLGLQRNGGPAFIVSIRAWSSAVDRLIAAPTARREVLRQSGTSWIGEPEPSWLEETARAWLKQASPAATTNKWAIHVRIPVVDRGDISDVGINLGDVQGGQTFKLWYEVDVHGPGGVTPFAWPRAAVIAGADPATLSDAYPAPTTWGDFSISSDPTCWSGVSLSPSDVGTTSVDAATGLSAPNTILFKQPSAPGPAPTNEIFARPSNGSPMPIAADAISATFRIANWGSQPDWNDVPDPTKSLWKEIRPGVVKQNLAPIPPGSQGTIQFPWRLTDPEAAEFTGPSATRRNHQCLYVELAGADVDFANDSVYRNMDFGIASSFESEAEISVAGLPSLAGSTHRDVYLFVDARNMPEAHIPAENEAPGPKDEPITQGGQAAPSRPETEQPMFFEDVARRLPTYMVHAFRDTGMRRPTDERTWRVLEPQTSFGYFVGHSGSLAGWEHELSGHGLQEIVPNFYRLSVPNGGATRVTIRIEALEKPRPWWRWLWKLLRRLIRLILAAIRRLLKQ